MNQESKETNVVSIFAAKQKLEASKNKDEVLKDGKSPSSVNDLFQDIINRNLSNADRMKKDRLKANKSVLRSYRIKKKK